MEREFKKILIIEDERPLLRALELKLQKEGFLVETLLNGEGLLPLIKKNDFSLIVCDLVMPKIDGFHVLKTLKDENIDIPVVVLTNLGQEEDEKRVRDLGARDYFVKTSMPLASMVSYIKENFFSS